MFIQDLVDINKANRLVELQAIEENDGIPGDFKGSVTGVWVKLDLDGTGVVKYNDKLYKTQVLGIASIPAGSYVEMSHAGGTYYSTF